VAEAAKQVLTIALRRRKGRSDELLHVIRYERALAYEQMSHHRCAQSDLESIYTEVQTIMMSPTGLACE